MTPRQHPGAWFLLLCLTPAVACAAYGLVSHALDKALGFRPPG